MSSAESTAAPAAAPATTEPAVPAGLVEEMLGKYKDTYLKAARVTKDESGGALKALETLINEVGRRGPVVAKDVEDGIRHWITKIDALIKAQLDEILHAPDFQRLEASWRGLDYLVRNSNTSDQLKIRVLNVDKDVLFDDLERAPQFDQSKLFKKVYEAEYGVLGGQPYGMLVGDYDFGRSAQDVGLLKMISGVAAMSHAPFVANANPTLFGFENWTELNNPRDLSLLFDTDEYASWRSFRKSDDSRYIALAMPRVMARYPYGKAFKQVRGLNYEEGVDGREHDKYLWMNASWAYAQRITDAVHKFGWMARTRRVEGGGRVENLPVHTFSTDQGGVAMKCPTEVLIPDRREFELSNLGFLPLLHCKGSDYAAFLGAQSCQMPEKYFDPDANANAELSAKFNYIMCVSRFAHYLKVMARNKVGSFLEAEECQKWLNDWIMNYTISQPEMASDEAKAQHPLQKASVTVRAVKGKPGYYEAVAYLRPHFQLEAINVSMRLVAEIPKKA
jgi:type VI secretion system protein ImpC